MADFEVRPASAADARELAELLAAVAEERLHLATEPPVDVDEWTERFAKNVEGFFVAVVDDRVVGHVAVWPRHGVGTLAMAVARDSRRRGVGSALLAAAIEWARLQRLHKLELDVFPHNDAAIELYRKFGFVEEGRRVQHYRRASGELWDAILMGLPLG
jgi:L-phenylalanine/L-methionine N-acetyltransferase